jgi:hypothetical protein
LLFSDSISRLLFGLKTVVFDVILQIFSVTNLPPPFICSFVVFGRPIAAHFQSFSKIEKFFFRWAAPVPRRVDLAF